MPRTSKTEAPVVVDEPVIESRYVDLGGYTVGYETFKADVDPAPLFVGLPDGRCPCPRWGIVVRYADHEETFRAGDAYYGAPGHLPLVFAGTEVIEFSPTDELNRTMAVITANMNGA
jgi:hypothetical protein